MPELPEVEIMAHHARQGAVGRRLMGWDLADPRLLTGDLERLRGRRLRAAWRRAKHLVLDFSEAALVLHFRMTGVLVSQARGRAHRLHLEFDGGDLFFLDPRRLGTAHVLEAAALDGHLSKLGPEPWPERRGGDWWRERLTGARAPLKPALLHQHRVAGIGNIGASESCWGAGLDPRLPISAIGGPGWERLAGAVREWIDGTLTRERDAGLRLLHTRGALNPFHVYGQAGAACPRCGTPIERLVQSGRSTYWCPGCQGRGAAC